jgi:hypothetical protein
MVLFDEKEVNAIKEYLKQIEIETMEMADRLKLDAQVRWGLEDKFKKAYAALEIQDSTPKIVLPPKVMKIDAKIKK